MDSLPRTQASPGGHKILSAFDCARCQARGSCLPACGAGATGVGQLVGRRLRVARDAPLYHCGDAVNGLFYAVRYGSFKTYRADAGGRPRLAGFQLGTDMLGLDAIGLHQHSCTVVALEDSEVCEVASESMHGKHLHNAALQRLFHGVLSKEIAREQYLAMLLRNTRADQRLAAFLLQLSWRYAARGYSASQFRLAMSRIDIADLLGLTPESVSRLLYRFKQSGLIELSGRDIRLHDAAALQAVVVGEGDAAPPPTSTAPLPRGTETTAYTGQQ
jgi:CRP/FNR family transcriptional regulator